jgi:carbamoyltransferase
MKNIVNSKIKFRELFRPFAPSVLVEKAEDFFELPKAERHFPARFMLYVTPVKEEKRKQVPAITHVDGSARPQIVFKEQNPLYYGLIERFASLTGVPLLLNTSFNLKGEPIVCTPQDAFNTFTRSGLDLLVLGNCLIKK